jgi:hypothetical protein
MKILTFLVLAIMVTPSLVVSGANVPMTANVREEVFLSVESGANNSSTDDEALRANFEKVAEKLLELCEKLHERVNTTLERFGVDEVPGEVRESLRLGVEAMAQARSLFEAGNFEEATLVAHQAMNHFSSAFRHMEGAIPEEPEEEDVEAQTERTVGLKVAIERAHAFLDKIEASALNLREEGHDVDAILAEIENAKASLDEALAFLDQGEISSAARAMTAAQGTLGRSNAALNGVTKQEKERRAGGFLEQVQVRARDLNGTIFRLQTRLQERNALSVRAALGATERKLERLRERIGEGDLDEVLDELEDAIEQMDDELDVLNGNDTANTLKEMNRVEARIMVLQRTEERLRNRGEDTPEIQNRLNVSTALLAQMKQQLEAGDLEAVGALIEQADESFKGARYEIRDSNALGMNERIREKLRDMTAASVADGSDEGGELVDVIRALEKRMSDFEFKVLILVEGGANASDVEAEVNRARNLLREASDLAGEDPEAAGELIDAAEAAADEIEDLLGKLLDVSTDTSNESEEKGEYKRPKGDNTGANQTTG